MMSVLNGLLIIFLLRMVECSGNFTTVGNSELLIVEDKLPFLEAEEGCGKMDSVLVEFWNHDEWQEVLDSIKKSITHYLAACYYFQLVKWVKQQYNESDSILEGFWIGLTDIGQEGDFRWRSNRTLSSDVSVYWGWKEPNNVGKKKQPENCAEVGLFGPYLNDIVCATKLSSICQKRLSFTTGKDENLNSTLGKDENFNSTLWIATTGVLGGAVVLLFGSLLYLGYRMSHLKKSVREGTQASHRIFWTSLFQMKLKDAKYKASKEQESTRQLSAAHTAKTMPTEDYSYDEYDEYTSNEDMKQMETYYVGEDGH